MIELGSACGAVEHTALVSLEDVLVGLNDDGKRTVLEETGLHLVYAFRGDEAIAESLDVCGL